MRGMLSRALVELIFPPCLLLFVCSHFMSELGCQVVPPYMIATKEAVKERTEPVWTRRKNLPSVTDSYHIYMTNVSTHLYAYMYFIAFFTW